MDSLHEVLGSSQANMPSEDEIFEYMTQKVDGVEGMEPGTARAFAHDIRMLAGLLDDFTENDWHNMAHQFILVHLIEGLAPRMGLYAMMGDNKALEALLVRMCEMQFGLGYLAGEHSEHIKKCTCDQKD